MHSFSALRSARIVIALGWADFLLKYRGSFLGYLWSFIVPLVKFLVILHIFRPFVADIPAYPLYLFLGLILWEHFSMTTSACIHMPQDKSAIIKKIAFPRLLLMLSVGWMHVIIFFTYICILFAFIPLMGASLTFSAVWYVPILALQASLIALGVGMLLGSYALLFRDIQHLWGVVLQVLFWLTPIMYAYTPSAPLLNDALSIVRSRVSLSLWHFFDIFIRFQPLSVLIHDARRALLYSDTLGVPSWLHIGLFTAFCAALFLVGAFVFMRRSVYFIQEY
jgi:ABC-type polysaccharide/polyol phosphate export permease